MRTVPENLVNEINNSAGRKALCDFLNEKLGKPELIKLFDRLTELYFEVNSVVNISALRTVDDVYIKHYLDSVYPIIEFSGNVCDVGCGGGFPTIPLAIANPDLNVTGLDSVGKKLMLITRARSELSLSNVSCDYGRAEEIAAMGKRFDTVCARAVADVNKSLSFCAPLSKIGGKIILYRTQNDELPNKKTLTKLRVEPVDVFDYELIPFQIKRRLMILKKL